MPELPTDDEARCYLLSVGENLTQRAIADRLGISQRTAGRAIISAKAKIEDLLARKLITRDALEREMRRACGMAAHGDR